MSEANAINLPDSWRWASLEDLVRIPKSDIVDGPFGSNLKASEYVEHGIPIIRLQNMNRNMFVLKNIRYVTEQKARDLSRHSFIRGDIVISKLGDPLGEACVVPDDLESGIIVADVVRVRLPEGAFNKLAIVYALNSQNVQSQFRRLTKGTTRPRINLNHVRSVGLPIPPRPEQDRIVAEIEKQFTRLDAAVAALKRVRANLKRYRAAVLKSACEGRLVPTEADLARTEGRTYETGEQLLARILKERRAKWEVDQLARMQASGKRPQNDDWKKKYIEPEPLSTSNLPSLPEGWIWVRAEQICEFITKGTTPSAAKLFDAIGDVPFIKVYNLTNRGVLDFSVKPTFVEKSTHAGELARSRVMPGDVLMNIVGPPLGKVSIVPDSFPEWNINQAIAIFRPISGLDRRYLAALLLCDDVLRWAIRRAKATAGQFNLTLEICRDLPLPLPPLSEQIKIVETMDVSLTTAESAERALELDIQRADRLRQSILKRAFEGNLVPQDPNDEPASAVLERIRAERNAQSASANSRGNRTPRTTKKLDPIGAA